MVTYQDLPKEVDPIAHLFGDVKLTVPESQLTPELIARFYEQGIKVMGIEELQHCTNNNPDGLKSLPDLLRYEPGHYGEQWLSLTARKEAIAEALPTKTPYQLQYFVVFGFEVPRWKDMGSKMVEVSWGEADILTPIVREALLVGKNGLLYLVTATWSPESQYFASKQMPRNRDDEGPYVFALTHLDMQIVDWHDNCIIDRIRDGRWSDTMAFRGRIQLALKGSAEILENRASRMRNVAGHLDRMSIYYGR